MSEESVQSQQDSKTESSPDKKSPPEDAPSPPEGSPAPPQGSPPPPTEGEKTPPPASSSNDKAPPVSPSSSSPPASTPPPDSTHSPTPSPPKTEVSSSPPVSPPPSEGSSKPTPPSQESPTSPVSPPPAPNFDAAQTPKASPNHPSPPTSSDKSPEFSPPPPISPSAESIPTPPASNVPAPPAQITSPPSDKSPPKAVPSPQTPGSPPATSTQTPTPSNVPSSTSTTPASQTPNYVPKLSHPSTQSSSDSSTPSGSSTSSKSSTTSGGGAIVGITLAGVVIIAFFAFFVARRRKRKREEAYIAQYKPSSINFSGQPEGYYYHTHQHTGGTDSYYGGKPPAAPPLLNSYGSHTGYSPGAPDASVMGSKSSFSYEELTEITNGFSRQNLLGEGGFGYVYKGWLQDGRVVAVKQLKAGSGQGEREFQAEVEIISRVHHRHLVSLVGYCIAEHQRLLVYEFVPNNTLDHHLHGKGIPVMEWSKRVKIALGAARGLAYLHEDCHPKIIHRDIKSSNILLDDVFEAQVSDFGLAKLTTDTHTHVSTRVMGTFGYMAPEYASSGKLTDRSDVFSFGVMLLEILTGRKPVDPNQPFGDESLVEWARPLLIHALESGDFEEIVDPRLEKRYVESEMFRMIETASACVRHSAQKRPRMSQVVRALDTEGEMGDISNGVKVGQSTVFEKGQHSTDIQKFRMLAFGSDDSSEYNSGETNSKEWSSASGGKLLR